MLTKRRSVFRSALALWALFVLISPAYGADPDRTMPTYLPWTGTQLNLDEANSYLAFSINRHWFRGALEPLRLGLRVTTPIEGDKRVVTSTTNPAHFNFGYNFKLTVSWDTSILAKYDVPLPAILEEEVCPAIKKGKRTCSPLEILRWRETPAGKKRVAVWKRAQMSMRRLVAQAENQRYKLQMRWYRLRNLLVQVNSVSLTSDVKKICQEFVKTPVKSSGVSSKAMKKVPGAFQRALRFVQRKSSVATRCVTQIRLALLDQEKRITTFRHRYESRQRTLRTQIALYNALNTLDQRLQQNQTRPLAMHLFPSSWKPPRSRFYWSAGVEFLYGFDNIFLYRYPLAPRLEPLNQTAIQIGPVVHLFFAPWLSVTLKAGLEWDKEVEIGLVESCVPGAAANTQVCDKSYELIAHPWYTRFYFRSALTSMFQFEKVTFGGEVRFSVENLGLDVPGEGTLLDARLVFFTLAKSKNLYSRFNVGLGIVHVVGPTRRDRFAPGTTALVPFVGVGGGF